VTQAATIPGGISGVTSGMSSPVVPLGQLSLQVNHASSGLAYAGAAVTITASTSGCTNDAYTLQATGADGLSRTEVPFGSYTLSVAGTSVGSVVVNQSSVVFTPTSGVASTSTLPTPVGLSL
jgi:hypothetical protein